MIYGNISEARARFWIVCQEYEPWYELLLVSNINIMIKFNTAS